MFYQPPPNNIPLIRLWKGLFSNRDLDKFSECQYNMSFHVQKWYMSGTATDFSNNPRTKISRSLGTTHVLLDMTTKVPCPKVPRSPQNISVCPTRLDYQSPIPRSPGTTRDIPGCPSRHDYQSPRSKSPKKSWDNSGHSGMSYYQSPMSKSPKKSWDNSGHPGCPSRHDYQSPRSKSPMKSWDNSGHPGLSYQTWLPKSQVQKSQEVLGQLGTSRDVLPDMTTKVPGPKVLKSPTRDISGCPSRHDYQSPRSKSPKKSWDNSGHPGISYQTWLPKSHVQKSQEVLGQLGTSRDVLPDVTTKVPGPKVLWSPGTSRDVLPDMTTEVPGPKVPRSKSWDNSGNPGMYSKPFLLQTDASDRGISAVLSQDHDQEEKPVAFFSRKLLDRERRYDTTKKPLSLHVSIFLHTSSAQSLLS